MKKWQKKIRTRLLAGCLLAVLGAQTAWAAMPYPDAAPAPGILHGWHQSGDDYWYYDENGEQVLDGISVDGYYLDLEGRWRKETYQLFNETYKVADRYTPPSEYGDFTKTLLEDLSRVNTSVRKYIGSARLVRMNDEAITYNSYSAKNNTEKIIFGLYKDTNTDGWRLRLAGYLGDRSGKSTQLSTYDYLVFRFLLSKISHAPGYVCDGIYDSWQGKNRFGINSMTPVRVADVEILVRVVNGAADYYITGAH